MKHAGPDNVLSALIDVLGGSNSVKTPAQKPAIKKNPSLTTTQALICCAPAHLTWAMLQMKSYTRHDDYQYPPHWASLAACSLEKSVQGLHFLRTWLEFGPDYRL